MDREKIIKSLLSKTVERGCTQQEADAAQSQAKKLAEKWGVDLKDMERSLFLDGLSKRQRMRMEGGYTIDFSDVIRRAAQAAASRAHNHDAETSSDRAYAKRHGAPPPPRCKHRRRFVYKGMPEAFKCKDCGFFTQEWQKQKDIEWDRERASRAKQWKEAGRKPKKNAGTTNPFGVHGRGTDPEGKWDSVADFVMWHLKNTDMPFEDIALQSRLKFSGKTSKNSVAWYANKIKKQGGTIPDRRK